MASSSAETSNRPFKLTDCPKQAAHTTAADIDGQTCVINLNSGTYITLNGTATYIWNRCDGQTSLAQISALLAEETGHSPDLTDDDVLAFASTLTTEGVIEY